MTLEFEPIKLRNEDILHFTSAWPSLEELILLPSDFYTHCRSSIKSELTLAGRVPLAQHCHHLKELSLPLNMASGFDVDPGFTADNNMEIFYARTSRFHESISATAAKALLDLFPRIWRFGDFEGHWKSVQESMQTLRNLHRNGAHCHCCRGCDDYFGYCPCWSVRQWKIEEDAERLKQEWKAKYSYDVCYEPID